MKIKKKMSLRKWEREANRIAREEARAARGLPPKRVVKKTTQPKKPRKKRLTLEEKEAAFLAEFEPTNGWVVLVIDISVRGWTNNFLRNYALDIAEHLANAKKMGIRIVDNFLRVVDNVLRPPTPDIRPEDSIYLFCTDKFVGEPEEVYDPRFPPQHVREELEPFKATGKQVVYLKRFYHEWKLTPDVSKEEEFAGVPVFRLPYTKYKGECTLFENFSIARMKHLFELQ